MSDYFIYNGILSDAYHLRVFPTDSMLKAPAHKYEEIVVPGRSGALLMDQRSYDNVPREYDIQIANDVGLQWFNALRNYLASCSGYLRLEDSFDNGHFFLAAYTEPFDMTADFHSLKRGRGTITFNCKPQRFLTDGETVRTYTSSGTIVNPTRFSAKPLIRVYGAGVLGIGGTNITIAGHGYNYIDIDCETGRAYYGATSLDSKVTLNAIDFPALAPGSNGITKGSGISRIEITPRWWEL